MHEATITAEYINQPDKNPDFGSVKSGSIYYGVPRAMLSQFEKGKTYTVGYTTTEGRNGKTFYNIKELRSSIAPKPQTNGHAPVNGNGKDQHMISALALYNHSFPAFAARSEGEIDRTSMGRFLFECRIAIDMADHLYKKFWTERAAPKPPPAPEPDTLDDEIPF